MRVASVILGGAIKYWWNENWETEAHWHYDAWRTFLNDALVANKTFLVYRPHDAFKGTWDERMQAVNDTAIITVDVFIDMTPKGIPSLGTDSEKQLAASHGGHIVSAPPPATKEEFEQAAQDVITTITALGVHQELVDQEEVLETIGNSSNDRGWLFDALFRKFHGNVARLHYIDEDGHMTTADVNNATLAMMPLAGKGVSFYDDLGYCAIALYRIQKVEILARSWIMV